MIGSKKLGTIRQELFRALADSGKDPIQWLEESLAAQSNEGAKGSGESEVMQSLRRIVEAAETTPKRLHRTEAKK